MGRLFYLVAALLRCVSVVWFYSEFINHRGHRGCTEKNAILCLCLFVADKFEG